MFFHLWEVVEIFQREFISCSKISSGGFLFIEKLVPEGTNFGVSIFTMTHLQGDMHMVVARLGCQNTMVGTGWANSSTDCMDRLRKRYSHLVGGSFLAGKAAWALSGGLTTESADYCMLVNEWAWLR